MTTGLKGGPVYEKGVCMFEKSIKMSINYRLYDQQLISARVNWTH